MNAYFFVIAGYLYKMGTDEFFHRNPSNNERQSILVEAHGGVFGRHHARNKTV